MKITYPATVLTTLALAGCVAADAKAPRFPDPLPPHTYVAYAQSYGGFVGGHAYVIVTTDGKARVKCRFKDKPLHRHVKPHRWDRVLNSAHLGTIKNDDPNRTPVESPEIWIRYRGRVTYRQSFAHKGGYPKGVFDVEKAFERYLDHTC